MPQKRARTDSTTLDMTHDWHVDSCKSVPFLRSSAFWHDGTNRNLRIALRRWSSKEIHGKCFAGKISKATSTPSRKAITNGFQMTRYPRWERYQSLMYECYGYWLMVFVSEYCSTLWKTYAFKILKSSVSERGSVHYTHIQRQEGFRNVDQNSRLNASVILDLWLEKNGKGKLYTFFIRDTFIRVSAWIFVRN